MLWVYWVMWFDFMTKDILTCLWSAVCLCMLTWFHAWFVMQVARGYVSIYGCVCTCVSLLIDFTIKHYLSIYIKVNDTAIRVPFSQWKCETNLDLSTHRNRRTFCVCVQRCVSILLHANVSVCVCVCVARVWPWFNLGAGVIPEIDRFKGNLRPCRH